MVLFPRSFYFSTKAETLERLSPHLTRCLIPELLYFTCTEWRTNPSAILERIATAFADRDIIVRSSALNEDGAESARAGEFLSVPNIPAAKRERVIQAIDEVVDCYRTRHTEATQDQILVQEMVRNVSMSGVLFTQDLNSGAPYFVINYDDQTGRTDTVSAGNGEYSNRTLLVHRESRHLVRSERFVALLDAVSEIEDLAESNCLDIEFALGCDQRVYLLQVRQITTQPNWNRWITLRINDAVSNARSFVRQRSGPMPGIRGSKSVFGKMPDWNPVEMIGTAPRPLALSLYRYLITDRSWRVARRLMGYAEPHGMPLMVALGGQPFIDVRLSFHSFLPADLPVEIGNKLVNAWLDRLHTCPHLHDKVEFDVAITALAFDFDQRVDNQLHGVLDAEELASFRDCLHRVTASILEGKVTPIEGELERIEYLDRKRKTLMGSRREPEIASAACLLEDCIEFGTIPFSILARHAFIANSLLKSLVARGVLSAAQVDNFQSAVPTVAGEFVKDTRRFACGEIDEDTFMECYGHLRPGTYDILSPRYDSFREFFESLPTVVDEPGSAPQFSLAAAQEREIACLLREFNFDLTVPQLFNYMAAAIKGREYAKFVFSRNISDALEIIAAWGERRGLSREELSYIDIRNILDSISVTRGRSLEENLRKASDLGRREHEAAAALQLPYLIHDETDVVIIPLLLNKPNFITQKTVRAGCKLLGDFSLPLHELDGRIVVIEGADPGFDWIFARPIAGLITKFGGANSHMAIRCAEFGLPAAIGCGEQIYDRVLHSKLVEINCCEQRIELLEH